MNENQDSYKFDDVEVTNDVTGDESEDEENSSESLPEFMDLGAPKDNRNVHLDNLLIAGHPTGHYHVNRDVSLNPVRRVFRIVIEPHTRTQYVLWAVFAVIIGLSLVSFLTESALLVAAKFRHVEYAEAVNAGAGLANDASDTQNANNAQMNSSTAGNSNSTGTSSVATATSSSSEYSYPSNAKIPKVNATEYALIDVKTGEIILQKNADMVFPLASVSKLMTALVAVENLDPKRMAIVSKNSYNTYGAEGNLVLGEKLKISDLMHPLLMESSNDGAEVIADDYGRVEFMSLMNKKAAELGMTSTYYNDPSGLDPKNNSTAKDQFKLAKYIFEKYPSIFDTTLVKIYKVGTHTWTNRNGYLNFPTYIGGKNGYIDEAKQTTVSLFDVPMYKGGNRTVVLVILQSVDRYSDGMKLIEFLKNNVTYKPLN